MFCTQEHSAYVNTNTVVLTLVMSMFLFFILYDSNKNNNPLLLVLVCWSLFYYVIRVITLIYTDYSLVLDRCGATAEDVNNSMLLTIASVIILWIVLRHAQKRVQGNVESLQINYKKHYVKKTLIVYWIAFFINVVAEYNLPMAGLALIIRNFILNINDLLYLVLVYIILIWDELEKKDKKNVLLSLLAFVAFITLNGSRAGFYTIFRMLFFVFLALGYKKIRRIYVFGVGLLFPIMIIFFVYSTYMRQMQLQKSSLSEKVALVSDMRSYASQLEKKAIIGPVADRLGFLDYTSEMVVMRDRFKSFINIESEFKSIVDNALTPGFDLFDAPRISNVILNSYEFGKNVISSKIKNSQEDYHSDELTAFGESYVLFGFPFCLFFIGLSGGVFCRVWIKSETMKNEKGIFLKAMCLYLFDVFLSSYGFDWLALDVVCFYITYMIFKTYVFSRQSLTTK